jgi:hypothetical protein
MNEVLASLQSHPYAEAPPDPVAQLARLEEAHECRLPDDFKELYRSVGEAELFDGRYTILRISDAMQVPWLRSTSHLV